MANRRTDQRAASGAAEAVDQQQPVVGACIAGYRAPGVEAAVRDVELVGVQGVPPAASGDAGVQRPVAGKGGQRRQRIGGPARYALEPVRDGSGDAARQPGADEVGEYRVAGLAKVHVGDLSRRQHADRAGHVERYAEGAREVVRGAKRQDAQSHVPVGEAAGRFADRAVPAADDQQVRPQIHRGGQAGTQPAGPVGGE